MSMSCKGKPADNAIMETFYVEGILTTLNDLSSVVYRKKIVKQEFDGDSSGNSMSGRPRSELVSEEASIMP